MYAVSNVGRVYISVLLLLCAAVLLAPSLANANEYWSVLEKRWIPADQTPDAVKEMLGHKVSRPSGTTLAAVPSAPTITKNAAGGLSASTNQILKTMGQPSSFTATPNYSLSSARNALKSCVRSPACAGRALGAGAIIYEGIQAWKDVYDILLDDNGELVVNKSTDIGIYPPNTSFNCNMVISRPDGSPVFNDAYIGDVLYTTTGRGGSSPECSTLGSNSSAYSFCSDYRVCRVPNSVVPEKDYQPVTEQELDDLIDNYTPEVSDAPIVLLSGDPETITLSTPASAELPSTTTTNTDSQGKTTTTVKNSVITYNIINNNTSSPSIESTVTETTNTYDDTANLVGSMTSTTTNNPVAPDLMPPSSSGASADIEIPPFCTWASIVCDWIGWTQEPLDEEEPDLSQLITVFEPDEESYDLGIGSGTCPAPMMLNLGIINKTVEVKYDPFCDFLEMIRPFVLAAAYLFAAYMYLGVLRRG